MGEVSDHQVSKRLQEAILHVLTTRVACSFYSVSSTPELDLLDRGSHGNHTFAWRSMLSIS